MAQIRVNDLVYVMRYPHCGGKFGGVVGTVRRFTVGAGHCHTCGLQMKRGRFADVAFGTQARWMHVSWLKRIDAPKQSETIEKTEEVTA